jgi:AcrR family transcriptional regulator
MFAVWLSRREMIVSDLPQPATARGEATRQRLLEAAELEFGEKGFNKASVSSITQRAGVGQGTFYLYFPSKEDTLRELVRHMGLELRRTLSEAIAGLDNRIEIEHTGFEAFVSFCLEKENLYRVVMESQFVDETIYREYYQTLVDAYATGLKRAQVAGQIRSGNAEAQAWALMGIAHFLGLRYAIWEQRKPPSDVMQTVFDLMTSGLKPEEEV